MGMDLVGMNAKSASGEYTRYNMWRWTALAAMCCEIAPAETEPCQSWFINDGYGLEAVQSELLAKRLEQALVDGSIDPYLVELRSFPHCYYVNKKDISNFVTFLRECGGFRIW